MLNPLFTQSMYAQHTARNPGLRKMKFIRTGTSYKKVFRHSTPEGMKKGITVGFTWPARE